MTDPKNDGKQRYEAPRLIVHGGVAEITGFDPLRLHPVLGNRGRLRLPAEPPKPS